MKLDSTDKHTLLPQTQAVRRALRGHSDAAEDLLFFETWQIQGSSLLADTLRAWQIRRANPGLAQKIDAEVHGITGGGRATSQPPRRS